MKIICSNQNHGFSRAQGLFVLCVFLLLFEGGSRYLKEWVKPKPSGTNQATILTNLIIHTQEVAVATTSILDAPLPAPTNTVISNRTSKKVVARPTPTAVQTNWPLVRRSSGGSGGGAAVGASPSGMGNGKATVRGVPKTTIIVPPSIPGVRVEVP